MKTLVLVGYHGREREFGFSVEDKYIDSFKNNGVEFFQLYQTPLDFDSKSDKNTDLLICSMLKNRQDISLLIDIHCNYHNPSYVKKLEDSSFSRGYLIVYDAPLNKTDDLDGQFKDIDYDPCGSNNPWILRESDIRMSVICTDYVLDERCGDKTSEDFKDGVDWTIEAIDKIVEIFRKR